MTAMAHLSNFGSGGWFSACYPCGYHPPRLPPEARAEAERRADTHNETCPDALALAAKLARPAPE